ncbi:MAG: hypothetical protein ACT4QD_13230 [Acidobacteriota bacterium]
MIEAGLLLSLIPWTTFWDRNYFADLVPEVRPVLANHFIRGAVSGLGLVNLWAALGELVDLLGGRRGVAVADRDEAGDAHAR